MITRPSKIIHFGLNYIDIFNKYTHIESSTRKYSRSNVDYI